MTKGQPEVDEMGSDRLARGTRAPTRLIVTRLGKVRSQSAGNRFAQRGGHGRTGGGSSERPELCLGRLRKRNTPAMRLERVLKTAPEPASVPVAVTISQE